MRINNINRITKLEQSNKYYETKLAELNNFKCDDKLFIKRKIKHYKTLIKNNNRILKKCLK